MSHHRDARRIAAERADLAAHPSERRLLVEHAEVLRHVVEHRKALLADPVLDRDVDDSVPGERDAVVRGERCGAARECAAMDEDQHRERDCWSRSAGVQT
jgi:hypothetical protein